VFLVRSGEQNFCPCCGKALKVIGSRKRNFINGTGERVVLIIRRLKCESCGRVHHELPDILVPYKRYNSESIEAVITDDASLSVAVDESTIYRWKHWFLAVANHFLGSLISIAIRFIEETAEHRSEFPQSPLQRIWQHVGEAPRWLARVVRSVANANLWVQTRSAFLSG
jgi:hypothetical protein